MHAKDRPLAVLYRPGADPWIMERCQSSGARTYGSPADALRDLCPAGRLGIEEDDVAIGTWRGFALDGRDTAAAGGLIRRWRDNNTRPDIAFYVIAGRASVAATERALEFAGDAVRRGRAIVETDIFAVYLDCLRDFIRKVAPELRLGRTLTNFHGGGRTVFPSNAAPRPVTKETGTFKIDAGCLLLDADGMLLGCSDIARTLCFTDDAQDLYLKFADAIRMTVVPACKAGAAGNDVHALAVEAIWNPARGPSGNPLVPELENPQAAYDRDVGHLLGRNNLAHLRLARGDATPLRAGMIACCEYQWPIANMAIAYEDTCLVGGSGGFNLVSDIGTPPRIY